MSSRDLPSRLGAELSRRRFVTGLAAGGVVAGALPHWPAFAAPSPRAAAVPDLRGTDFNLAIGRSPDSAAPAFR